MQRRRVRVRAVGALKRARELSGRAAEARGRILAQDGASLVGGQLGEARRAERAQRHVVLGLQMQSDAIRCNQMQSDAISCTQLHSAALRGSQRQSEAVRGTQRHSEAISCTQWHLAARSCEEARRCELGVAQVGLAELS